MKILVGYGTGEGHTRRIARHVADLTVAEGHSVELLNLADAEGLDLARFDRALLAASVHVNHYQRALGTFAAREASRLNAMPTLFLSVSLAAAGHDDEDWKGLERILADLEAATGWTPGRVSQIAGAFRPERYDVFRRFVMRRIIAVKDPKADLDAGKDYTDWPALDALVHDWLQS
ncbi:Protoporphyrinogen IX dehydrogenase [menaquinone] [Roseivivax jejudonensis]|uniref:Protoporphyrinogen IX dehydrogenase [menaquinone] n=1 Tax=Roseivivax jejudonensis TaxID=1529041 RepID=A0A1X7A7Y2_9RHOB|nr:flavodoxin domain-containing protein [Roseivivax jejudonensis]SLN72538.1 Protoporphyrinogen IX dehydrogenase [menaquinone] [Roseivivax jejudonensis]